MEIIDKIKLIDLKYFLEAVVMKKLEVIGIISLLLFLCGCKNPLEETKYLTVSLLVYNNETNSLEYLPVQYKSEFVEYYNPILKRKETKKISVSYVEVKPNDKFYAKYSLIPEQKTTVSIDEVYTDLELVDIEEISYTDNLIYCSAIKTGETKIEIHSVKYNTATSLLIVIKD